MQRTYPIFQSHPRRGGIERLLGYRHMVSYVTRRLLSMIPALLGIAAITFTLMHLTRGGPFDSERPNAQIKANLMRAYGLDQPLWPTFMGDTGRLIHIALLV